MTDRLRSFVYEHDGSFMVSLIPFNSESELHTHVCICMRDYYDAAIVTIY